MIARLQNLLGQEQRVLDAHSVPMIFSHQKVRSTSLTKTCLEGFSENGSRSDTSADS